MAATDPNPNLEVPEPERLREALRPYARETEFIPPSVDQAILRAARERLAGRRPGPARAAGGWRVWAEPPWVRWAAAGVGLALLLVAAWLNSAGRSSPRQMAARGLDLNGDGVVNILDALILARRIESSNARDSRNDLNGDGRVDQKDVDLLVSRLVSLENMPKGKNAQWGHEPEVGGAGSPLPSANAPTRSGAHGVPRPTSHGSWESLHDPVFARWDHEPGRAGPLGRPCGWGSAGASPYRASGAPSGRALPWQLDGSWSGLARFDARSPEADTL
jgi:hypothetical protein